MKILYLTDPISGSPSGELGMILYVTGKLWRAAPCFFRKCLIL